MSHKQLRIYMYVPFYMQHELYLNQHCEFVSNPKYYVHIFPVIRLVCLGNNEAPHSKSKNIYKL